MMAILESSKIPAMVATKEEGILAVAIINLAVAISNLVIAISNLAVATREVAEMPTMNLVLTNTINTLKMTITMSRSQSLTTQKNNKTRITMLIYQQTANK
jgi:hypothetical protein